MLIQWIRFIWLRIGITGEPLWMHHLTSRFPKPWCKLKLITFFFYNFLFQDLGGYSICFERPDEGVEMQRCTFILATGRGNQSTTLLAKHSTHPLSYIGQRWHPMAWDLIYCWGNNVIPFSSKYRTKVTARSYSKQCLHIVNNMREMTLYVPITEDFSFLITWNMSDSVGLWHF